MKRKKMHKIYLDEFAFYDYYKASIQLWSTEPIKEKSLKRSQQQQSYDKAEIRDKS